MQHERKLLHGTTKSTIFAVSKNVWDIKENTGTHWSVSATKNDTYIHRYYIYIYIYTHRQGSLTDNHNTKSQNQEAHWSFKL